MAICRSEAIILKTIPYGETSKILTVLSKDFGRLSLMAKGARDTKSKYGGSLELFTHATVIFYERENRDIQYLSDAVVIQPFFKIRDDLSRTYMALAVIEMIQKTSPLGELSDEIFYLLTNILKALNDADKRAMNYWILFMMEFSEKLGFRMNMENCDHYKHGPDQGRLRFNFDRGQLACDNCHPEDQALAHFRVSHESAATLAQMARSRGQGISNIAASEKILREMANLLVKHLQYHIEELKPINSLAFIRYDS